MNKDEGNDMSHENEDDMEDPSSLSDPNTAWAQIGASQVYVDAARTGADRKSDCTRLVLMSDTHGKHRQVKLPAGDCLIHGGDLTKAGETETIKDLSAYFKESAFPQVICIAGNHDITLHPSFYHEHGHRFRQARAKPLDVQASRDALEHCTYLEDSACTLNSGGSVVYGSPWTPEYYNWAFNLPRGKAIRSVWSRIPEPTDVLITHGPPLGRGDYTMHTEYTGCFDLLQEVQTRIQPRLHIFGHIHEGHGVSFDGHTLFVNAANLNSMYQTANRCVVIDLPHDTSKPAMVVEPQCQVQGSQLAGWLDEHGYETLSRHAKDAILPSDIALLKDSGFRAICRAWKIRQSKEAQAELQRALSELYAESF
jgi:Icc-related predicted phosphoesterase